MAKTSTTWLLAGLGNPGPEYCYTRHNIGFHVIDALADITGAHYWKQACGCEVAYTTWHDKELILAKPQSFMNLSGGPLSKLIKKENIALDHFIVINDDLDVAEGKVKLKPKGSANGHNGLRSIIQKIGSQDFCRIRCGIGRPPQGMDPAKYVLKRLSPHEKELFTSEIADAIELIEDYLEKSS